MSIPFPQAMLIVALTGGIATGKSVVADILEQMGCYIHHADKIAHQLMEPQKPAWNRIVNHFGQKILNKNKTINRKRLGAIVFNDEKERNFLNRILHPLVLKKKKEVIQNIQKRRSHKIFVSEAALTLEAGFGSFFDKIVVVYCRPEIQIKRLMERDQTGREQAIKRINAQMPPGDKLKYADYIIDTSGSLSQTVEQTERLFRNLMRDYQLKNDAAKDKNK